MFASFFMYNYIKYEDKNLFNYRFIRRVFLILLMLAAVTIQSYGFEIYYPKEKKSETTYDYGLFIGKARNTELISINNINIHTASNGAFAHSVKLKDGENRVVIRSNYSTKVYNVYKKKPAIKAAAEIKELEKRTLLVKSDNTPLRRAPEDIGYNIVSYLFKDTRLVVNGEKGIYYRVFLSKDKTAWILKSDVDENSCPDTEPASFVNMDSERFKNANVQTITFTKNLPYTVEDGEKEILFRVYNPELSDNSVYTLNILKPKKYFYNVTLNDGFYTFKVSEVPKTFEGCTIVVDAGHGGEQDGAAGCLGDKEKDINLKIALELQQLLKQRGANVVMTRECDGTITLKDRIRLAKAREANIYLSIHMNSIGNVAFSSIKHRGTGVYYFNRNSRELAEILEKTISKSAGTRRDGVKSRSFAVIRPANYVGVLIETAFMINPSDTLLYRSPEFAKNVAEGIVTGLEEFICE